MENQRIRLTRSLLQQALIDTLAQKDIAQISVREICQKAQLNRSTFYLHYQDLYQLLEEIQQDLLSYSVKSISKNVKDITPFLQYIKDNQKTYKVLLQSRAFAGYCHDFMEIAMKRMVDLNLVHQSSENRLYCYQFLQDGSWGIIRHWVSGNCKEDPELIANIIYKMCDNAVGNSK